MRQTVGILGTPIDILDTSEVLARLEQFITERRFHQVATANTDFLINALHDPELRRILRNADLVIPDGMPIVWASRMMGTPLPERVTGADIVPELAALSERKGYRLYMLGAREEISKRAYENLLAKHPNLQIVGRVSPKLANLLDMDNDAILRDIERAQPDILFVAFGNPKQEKWIYLHRERLGSVPVCIGVGGTFDFLAGETARAPLWMQKSGLEWVHRLSHEPRRLWRRYGRDLTHFSRYMARQFWAVRRNAANGHCELYVAREGGYTVLSLVGDVNAEALPRFQAAIEEGLQAKTHLILDFQGVRSFDAEALGTLLMLPKRAAYHCREARLVAPPRAIAEGLRRSQLDESLLKIVGTMAEAFSDGRPAGLHWRIHRGKAAVTVSISGAAERATMQRLETLCAGYLAEGKRLDLDMRCVTYVDTHLMSVLKRLLSVATEAARVQILPGSALVEAAQRERALPSFQSHFVEILERPADAVEVTEEEEVTPAPLDTSLPPMTASRI